MSNKPSWIKDNYGTNYGEIVESFGYEIVDSEVFGDYQGDYCYILRNEDTIGYVVIGYGSCSGCDALQAAEPWCRCGNECTCDWSALINLRYEILNNIKWEHPNEADPANFWWSYEPKIKKWLFDSYESALLRIIYPDSRSNSSQLEGKPKKITKKMVEEAVWSNSLEGNYDLGAENIEEIKHKILKHYGLDGEQE